MSWSSGVFTRFFGSTGWQDDKAAATKILASRHDSHDQDIATGLNVLLGNLQLNSHFKVGSVSGTNTITGALTPALTSYGGSMYVVLIPAATNTAATTLNLNGLGAIAVQNIDGTACTGGELLINIPAILLLNSGATAWIIVAPANTRGRLPLIAFSGNLTLTTAHLGCRLYYTGVGGHTLTCPVISTADSSSPLVLLRMDSSGTLTIAGSGTTIRWFNGSGTISSGSRTVAIGGNVSLQNSNNGALWDIEGSGIT